MPTRKPTIDGLDDTDDEDGVVEQERAAEGDLSLHVTDDRHAGLGHTPPDVDPYIEDTKQEERE